MQRPTDNPYDLQPSRQVVLTRADQIEMLPTHWLWEKRIPLGELAILAGKEGIGKSTAAYTLAAEITKGTLEGRRQGTPQSVVVAATEDDWARTVKPRLVGAGADCEKVHRVEVETTLGTAGSLTLPKDLASLEAKLDEVGDVALLLLDPLMSRLEATLDSHKDHDVRQALEPLTSLAQRKQISVLALMHVSKSNSDDPLTVVMASKAFVAVARSVLFAIRNPDEATECLLGLVKSNLGPCDVPTRRYCVEEEVVGVSAEGEDIVTGVLRWLGDSEISICEAQASAATPGGGLAVIDAAEWLEDWLNDNDGRAASLEAKRAGKVAGHSDSSIYRASKRLKIDIHKMGFPRTTVWCLPGVPPADPEEAAQDEEPALEAAVGIELF